MLTRHADLNPYSVTCPEMPTCFSHRAHSAPDVLDVFLHHLMLSISDVETLDELNSDHKHVLLRVDKNINGNILRNCKTKNVRWVLIESISAK